MAETFYVNVLETDNVDCVLDGMVELAAPDTNIICVSAVSTTVVDFSIVAGVYTVTDAVLTAALFAVGAKIIIRGSVDTTGLIDNDGCYTVVTNPAGSITVAEPVIAATSVSTTVRFDEFVTFILHPTKPTGQMLVFIESAAALAKFDVSFEPGGYWASKIETVCPVYQGSGVASKMYLLQIETAPYLKTVEKLVAVDATAANDVQTKGTILMRVFPGTSADPLLAAEMTVAYIMIA
ncbi:MAG: hypothetical protein IMZ64_12795 [Bacteroidetes bacterium]|nr:hypothetical protein [Bacteroidota bacterium]